MSKFKKQKTVNRPVSQINPAVNPNAGLEQLMAVIQLNQVMIQRMSGAMNELSSDVLRLSSITNDLQYRLLAMIDLAGIDKDALQEKADTRKLLEFDAESLNKDNAEGLTIAATVDNTEDTVILTSSTPDELEDKGILRSRIKISEMNQPELEEKLMGRAAGDTVEAQLNGSRHMVTILGVRRATVQEKSE